ncbi:flippase [Leptospira kanakyensis]|uniref:Flippase n=1 Tax=Leptospira kanakyensis TaxID=2484968 RepID=A0A6N4QEF8_9LEPT|nr:flippase [Leptospira kanakyensis]TGK57187.1 flippase [Leptospira kanakyensis]TGK71797.1 flippase [Leptospira kanakyensis]
MKAILLNSLWFFFDKVFKLAIGFTVSVLLIRYFGPEWFGKYNFLNSIVVLFSVLISFGSEGILIKLLVSEKENKNEILAATFWIHTGFSFIAFIASFFVLYVLRPDSGLYSYFFLLSLPSIFRCFSVVRYVYEALLQIKVVVIIENSVFFSISFIRFLMIIYEYPIEYIFVSFALEGIFASLGLFFYYRIQNGSFLNYKPKLNIIKKILYDSFPIFVSSFAVIVYMKVDQIMIGTMLGDSHLGIYSVGVRLSEFWYFIPIGLSSSFFPILIQLKKEISNQYLNRFLLLHSILFWIAFTGAVMIQFSGNVLVSYLYGINFENSAAVLKIHIWTAIFVFLGVAGSNYFILENLQKLTVYKSLIGLFTNIILNFFWIPTFGIIGAAYATLISQFCANTLFLIFFKQLHPLLKMQFNSLIHFRFNAFKLILMKRINVYGKND